jgi:hypothetical protein
MLSTVPSHTLGLAILLYAMGMQTNEKRHGREGRALVLKNQNECQTSSWMTKGSR